VLYLGQYLIHDHPSRLDIPSAPCYPALSKRKGRLECILIFPFFLFKQHFLSFCRVSFIGGFFSCYQRSAPSAPVGAYCGAYDRSNAWNNRNTFSKVPQKKEENY